MATKRFRNGKYQYVVKNKKLLPKPLYLTFDNEADGDAYISDLEELLSKGGIKKNSVDSVGTVSGHLRLPAVWQIIFGFSADERLVSTQKIFFQ